MANELTVFGQSPERDADRPKKNITSNKSEQSIKGAIVYKRDTGMAFKVVHMSHANGIAHYKLLCLETGSKYYLSKFAVEQNYTNEDAKTDPHKDRTQ